jgi:hypothetical protein
MSPGLFVAPDNLDYFFGSLGLSEVVAHLFPAQEFREPGQGGDILGLLLFGRGNQEDVEAGLAVQAVEINV